MRRQLQQQQKEEEGEEGEGEVTNSGGGKKRGGNGQALAVGPLSLRLLGDGVIIVIRRDIIYGKRR